MQEICVCLQRWGVIVKCKDACADEKVEGCLCRVLSVLMGVSR